MKRRDFLRHAALAAAGTAGLLGPIARAHAQNSPTVDPFYDHVFSDVDGQKVAFNTYLGKPLVLNFWATWCPPCVKEMPDLEALHKKYDTVHFVGVAIDTAVNVQKFSEKVQVSYPLLVAGHGGIAKMRVLGNKSGGLPFTVVFNAEGRIANKVLGQIKPEELDRYISDLI